MVLREIRVVPSSFRCSSSVSTARLTTSNVRCRLGSYTASFSQEGAWRAEGLRVDFKVHLWLSLLIFAVYFNHLNLLEFRLALFKFLLVLNDF